MSFSWNIVKMAAKHAEKLARSNLDDYELLSIAFQVRDLVAQCTCPTQFPMIRVSEGKYRIGDTKVLIFVRILRNHVMVRVGGGWDTLAHYLDKHDPCRCRAQHIKTQGARLVNKPGAMDLAGAQVYYERGTSDRVPNHSNTTDDKKNYLSLPGGDRARSRSPSATSLKTQDSRRSASPNLHRKSLAPPINRSRSPTPNFTSTHHTKLTTKNSPRTPQGPQSLPYFPTQSSSNTSSPKHLAKHANAKNPSNIISSIQIPVTLKSEAVLLVSDHSTDHSDNTSEVSDEGYRSLGVVAATDKKNRNSVYSQNSAEDAEYLEHHDELDLDDTNDMGLRKTNFSDKIYNPNEKIQKSHPHTIPPPKMPGRSNSLGVMETPLPSRIPPSSPRKTLQKPSNGSLNGKPKNVRPNLTPESFTSPFNRTSPARRSIASFQPVKRSVQSANTSPTKLNLRQELIQAAKHAVDDSVVIEEVHKLLRQYVSQNSLNEFQDIKNEEQKPARTRKDSRANLATRIPAPVK